MTVAKWSEAVKISKIKKGINPDSFIELKGELLKEAQIIYSILINSKK